MSTPTKPAKPERGLLVLPNEMLLRVRSHLHALQDHVYFSRTCKSIRELYSEEFFEFAVKSAGWGRTLSEQVQANVTRTWQAFASTLIANGRIFKDNKDIPKWAQYESIFEGEGQSLTKASLKVLKPDDVKRGKIRLKVDSVFYNWDVKNEQTPGQFTVPNYSDDEPTQRGEDPKLLDHPYLANRFITTPRVAHLDVDDDKDLGGFDIDNDEGVTVYDVYGLLADVLNNCMDPEYWQDGMHTFFEGLQNYRAGSCALMANWGS